MNYDRLALAQQLTEHEGLVKTVYKDSLGIETIGIGRNLEGKGITDAELKHWDMSMELVYKVGITREMAIDLFNNDVKIVERELVQSHPIVETLSAMRQMALVNMGFNLGIPRLNMFKNMWESIEDGDFTHAAIEMMDSRWARQVGQRAITLSNMMDTGVLD